MNDVDVLSSLTLAVASLATPAPSLQEETPHEEVEHQYLWRCFPDYVWSQRVRDMPSWVWGFGYDVEDSSGGQRWVCRRCIQNKNPKPRSFAEKGIQNANAHLFKGHGIRTPPGKTKSAAEKKAEKLKAKDQRSIAEVMKLDTRLPREQDIANSLAKGFDRKHFQRLLLEWIIEENHAFSVCEQGRLRQIFEYLSPLVKITDANITRTTIRRKVLSAYEMHKDKVVAALKQSCGLIHVSFDGWKSGNRHSLYGIACFFRDENSQLHKLALGVPELRTRHFGHNIAAEILDALDAYGIQDKIGYFTLDNAESNDKAMEVIGGELGFVGSRRPGRCFGHTLNLSAKALLFGHNVEAFEEQLSGEDGDNDVRDPISYWHERKRRYPRLSRMPLDFLTIKPMSAECERMFAAAGRMVTPLRNRLDADIIGMCQVLRSWLRARVINDLDVLLLLTENSSSNR
ncbi:hypothetical protein H9Q73_010264 [Fusarium xylarioides]|nr:hypothetical protein H9Q73_010264 [Fusarium xylarioides]